MNNVLPPSLGTELKLNVNADLGNGLHLSDVDFTARFYSSFGKSITIDKKDMKKLDDDNYIAVVDSKKVGTGEYWMRLSVQLPDADCEDGYRSEVVTVPTGVKLIG
jgi:hypothetical protein